MTTRLSNPENHLITLVSVFTIGGCLPLMWLAFATPMSKFLQFQQLGLLYLGSIICFLSGSLWAIALMAQKLWPIQLSVLFSLLPFLVICLKRALDLEIEAVWLLLYAECLLLLTLDWSWARAYIPQWYLACKTLASAVLGITIAVIIHRNLSY